MPAYIVMIDSSMDALCRVRPTTAEQLMNVMGFGEKKVEKYGAEILEELRRFEEGEREAASKKVAVSPAEETLQLLAQGQNAGRDCAGAGTTAGERGVDGFGDGGERGSGISAGVDYGGAAGEDSRGLQTARYGAVESAEGCVASGDYV